jgi:hypothetical protein
MNRRKLRVSRNDLSLRACACNWKRRDHRLILTDVTSTSVDHHMTRFRRKGTYAPVDVCDEINLVNWMHFLCLAPRREYVMSQMENVVS